MSPATFQNALDAAIDLAQTPVMIRHPKTKAAQVALLAIIDDGETVLAPTGNRVKSVDYAASRWVVRAIDVTQCAHSSRLVTGLGLVNDGGEL